MTDDSAYLTAREALLKEPALVLHPEEEMIKHIRRLQMEIASDFDQYRWQVQLLILTEAADLLQGTDMLMLAVHYTQKYGHKVLRDYHLEDRTLASMAGARACIPDDPQERALVIKQLRNYQRTALKAILPFADHAQDAILEALGWSHLQPVARLLVEKRVPAYEELVQATASIPDKEIKQLISIFKNRGWSANSILIEAFKDFNRRWLRTNERLLMSYIIRAYSILPLLNGRSELRERYEKLLDWEKKAIAKRDAELIKKESTLVQACTDAWSYLASRAGYESVAALRDDMK